MFAVYLSLNLCRDDFHPGMSTVKNENGYQMLYSIVCFVPHGTPMLLADAASVVNGAPREPHCAAQSSRCIVVGEDYFFPREVCKGLQYCL